MKKYIVVALVVLLIGIIYIFNDSKDSILEEKKASIVEQAQWMDVSNLFIFKEAPEKYEVNNYRVDYFGNGAFTFKDEYKFKNSKMLGLVMEVMIYGENLEEITDDQIVGEKINFKGVDASFNSSEEYMDDSNTYHVFEQLFFLKDNIKYLVSWNYEYDGKEKNKRDFIRFLNDSFVMVGQ